MSHNITFKTNDITQLLHDKFSQVIPGEWTWQRCHAEGTEEEFFEREGTIDEYKDNGVVLRDLLKFM